MGERLVANALRFPERSRATFQEAALCAVATVSVIRIVAILSGRRERTDRLPKSAPKQFR